MRPDRRLAPLLGAALAVLTTGCLVAVSLIGVSGADNSGDRLEAVSVGNDSGGAMILPEASAPVNPAKGSGSAPQVTTNVDSAPLGTSVAEVATAAAQILTGDVSSPRTLVGGLGLQAAANYEATRGSRTSRPPARQATDRIGSDDSEGRISARRADPGAGGDEKANNEKAKGKSHGKGKGHGKSKSHGKSKGHGHGHGHGHGKSKGHGSSAPASSPSSPGHSGGSPGNSGSTPSHSKSPGKSGSAHGHSGGSPGNSGKAKGHKKK